MTCRYLWGKWKHYLITASVGLNIWFEDFSLKLIDFHCYRLRFIFSFSEILWKEQLFSLPESKRLIQLRCYSQSSFYWSETLLLCTSTVVKLVVDSNLKKLSGQWPVKNPLYAFKQVEKIGFAGGLFSLSALLLILCTDLKKILLALPSLPLLLGQSWILCPDQWKKSGKPPRTVITKVPDLMVLYKEIQILNLGCCCHTQTGFQCDSV